MWEWHSENYIAADVLEANFVEPAHYQRSFEWITALSWLEARLVKILVCYSHLFYLKCFQVTDFLIFNIFFFNLWLQIAKRLVTLQGCTRPSFEYLACNKDNSLTTQLKVDNSWPIISNQNLQGSTSKNKKICIDKPINKK